MSDDDDKTVVFSAPIQSSQEEPSSAKLDVPSAKLVCTDSSQIDETPDNLVIKLEDENEITVGRGDSCEFPIKSRKLSRKHARIFPGAGRWGVEDLNSTNGVFVNGKRSSTAWLKHGDEVKFGPISFDFTLDKPDFSSAPAASTPSDDDGEEDVEKTMMFGSVKSSEVFLQAAKEAKEKEEQEKEAKKEEEPKPKKKIEAIEEKLPSNVAEKLTPRNIIAGAAALLIIIIALWYPGHVRKKEIADSIRKCEKITKNVISSTRDKTSAQVYSADYEKDLIKLNEISAKMHDLLEENQGNLALSTMTAKAAFLEFERDFAKLLEERNMPEAMNLSERIYEKIEKIEDKLPEKISASKKEEIDTIADLSRLAKTIVAFRSFAIKYPAVSETLNDIPSQEEIDVLQDKKADFTKYRRTYNRAMKVDFLVFKKIVDDIDKRDISLFNEWSGFIANRPDVEEMPFEPSEAVPAGEVPASSVEKMMMEEEKAFNDEAM